MGEGSGSLAVRGASASLLGGPFDGDVESFRWGRFVTTLTRSMARDMGIASPKAPRVMAMDLELRQIASYVGQD